MIENSNRNWFKSYPEDVSRTIEQPNQSVYMLLEETTKRFGSRVAIISDDDQKITYEQLKDKVDRLANAWHRMGLKKGERIGLMLPNTPYYVISYYAAVKLGLIVVQINPFYTVRELLKILSDSETNHIVIQEDNLDQINKVIDMHKIDHLFMTESQKHKVNILSHLIDTTQPTEVNIPIDIDNDVAVIQYTGGTTGDPKGVMLTHSNLVANALQSYTIFGDKISFGTEIVLTATPLYHVYAMTGGMNLGIFLGATIILVERYNVNNALEKIKKYRPTYFPGVPRMYNDFIHYPNVADYGLNCLRVCSSGSAPLPVEVINKFESLTGAVIAEGFGLSEASPSTHRNPPFGTRKIGSIGLPLPGTDCKIVDDDGQEVPNNSVGELIIKGPQVMKGYWKDEDETEASLKDGWLYTADLAMQDEDGYFYIVGRKKEMIISNGFNVYPQEIESVLYEHPDVKETAVVGVPDQQDGERIVAYIVLKENSIVTSEELKGHCYRGLTPYKVPKIFEFVESLPRNNIGKIIKTELVKMSTSK